MSIKLTGLLLITFLLITLDLCIISRMNNI